MSLYNIIKYKFYASQKYQLHYGETVGGDITSSAMSGDGADVVVGIKRHRVATRLKIIFQFLRSILITSPQQCSVYRC